MVTQYGAVGGEELLLMHEEDVTGIGNERLC